MSAGDGVPDGRRKRTMGSVAVLLEAWRAADRRWEATDPSDPTLRSAAIDVIRAWLAYHLATEDRPPGEIALVADEERRYVVASPAIEDLLGYPPDDLVGRRIEDLAADDLLETTRDRWDAFIIDGRQDGLFSLRASDGSVRQLRYQARAHYPIAGFHLSRLWPSPDQTA